MTYQVDIAEAQRRLLDLIQAAEQGEEVIITRDQQPLIQLVPLHQLTNRPQFWSVRVTRNVRVVGRVRGSTITWFWIGDHKSFDQTFPRS